MPPASSPSPAGVDQEVRRSSRPRKHIVRFDGSEGRLFRHFTDTEQQEQGTSIINRKDAPQIRDRRFDEDHEDESGSEDVFLEKETKKGGHKASTHKSSGRQGVPAPAKGRARRGGKAGSGRGSKRAPAVERERETEEAERESNAEEEGGEEGQEPAQTGKGTGLRKGKERAVSPPRARQARPGSNDDFEVFINDDELEAERQRSEARRKEKQGKKSRRSRRDSDESEGEEEGQESSQSATVKISPSQQKQQRQKKARQAPQAEQSAGEGGGGGQSDGSQSYVPPASSSSEAISPPRDEKRKEAREARLRYRYATGGNQNGRKAWTVEETRCLLEELQALYPRFLQLQSENTRFTVWKEILERRGPQGTLSTTLRDRNNVQLKDKARNCAERLLRRKEELPDWLEPYA